MAWWSANKAQIDGCGTSEQLRRCRDHAAVHRRRRSATRCRCLRGVTAMLPLPVLPTVLTPVRQCWCRPSAHMPIPGGTLLATRRHAGACNATGAAGAVTPSMRQFGRQRRRRTVKASPPAQTDGLTVERRQVPPGSLLMNGLHSAPRLLAAKRIGKARDIVTLKPPALKVAPMAGLRSRCCSSSRRRCSVSNECPVRRTRPAL